MADKKISQLTALSAANVAPATDVLAIVDTSATETKKITAKDLIDGALNGGTANGVLYLNGSKVATSGSDLTFNGTVFRNNAGGGVGIYGLTGSDSVSNQFYLQNTAGNKAANFQLGSTGILQTWVYGGSTWVNATTIDSSGNVGIGTASPGNKLSVNSGASTTIASFTSTGSAAYIGLANSGAITYIGNDSTSGSFIVQTPANSFSTKLTLTNDGNLGLGVTPSAWSGNYKTIQNFGAGMTSQAGSENYLTANAYFDGSWKRIYENYASRYEQVNSVHAWYIAGSSAAGSTIAFTQAMTLTAGGLLGVGTGSPASAGGVALVVHDSSTPRIRLTNSTTGEASTDGAEFNISGSDLIIENRENAPTRFFNNGSERARFTAGGYFKASDAGTYVGITSAYHELRNSANNTAALINCSNASFTSDVISIFGSRITTNSTYNLINAYNGDITGQFIVRDSGNAVNTNSSYGGTSDIKLKQDIVDASSQWNDIKNLRVRKYRFKDKPDEALQIGVIAQELEQVSPGLVEESVDRDKEGNDLGTTTKSVKYSVLYMKAVKALQEAMARIEQLEADMAALKASA